MVEINIVYSDPKQLNNLIPIKSDNITINTYDEMSYKERKIAFRIKGQVAARLTPLVVIKLNGQISKAFYREEFKDPIIELNKWLDDYENSPRLNLQNKLSI